MFSQKEMEYIDIIDEISKQTLYISRHKPKKLTKNRTFTQYKEIKKSITYEKGT